MAATAASPARIAIVFAVLLAMLASLTVMTAPLAFAAVADDPAADEVETGQEAADETTTEDASEDGEPPTPPVGDEEGSSDDATDTEQAASQDEASGSETPEDTSSAVAPLAAGDVQILAASPVYEITGRWITQPATISRGEPVVAEWRININDGNEPPSNDPVDNVTATFALQNAFYDEIPDVCLRTGVDPVSAISPDGSTLTCNFGTLNMGRAIVLQTPVVADGATGEEVALDGTSPSGETRELPRIPIVNPFVMDFKLAGNTPLAQWDDTRNPTYVDTDLQWSLRLGAGSDPGPNEVTYRIRIQDSNGGAVQIGTNPGTSVAGCTSFDRGNASGHPWSSVPSHHRHTNFVDECLLTPVTGQPGVFDLTLRGVNYSLANAPSHDASLGAGQALEPEWDYVASGSLWFRVITGEAGGLTMTVLSTPTYVSPTGQTATDDLSNNTTSKAYTLPGSWSSAWDRAYTGSGGTQWDDTYRVSAGTTVKQYVNNSFNADNVAPTAQYGNCLVLDTRYATYNPAVPADMIGSNIPDGVFPLDPPPGTIQYYVGTNSLVNPSSGQYNPDMFSCGTDPAGWTSVAPGDPSQIKAVRVIYPHSTYSTYNSVTVQLRAQTTINANVPAGQDVWMFGSVLRNGTWVGPGHTQVLTPTPDARYTHTNGHRDILRIVSAVPRIQKVAERATVTPGVPTEFTLRYSANGTGVIPATVDGYVIVDTLPQGVTYEPGSADPEPVVTTNQSGQQLLTWTLDDVPTNVWNELTYQAVVSSSVAPGTPLTNTAVSSYDGTTSPQAAATVTTTNNGFTTILKTADVEFIPNQNGDGVGTGSWTVEIESNDPQPQAYTDTIDILPYNGDQRGTSFSGTYTLDDVVLNDGGTVYYTDADPATLSDDPAAAANGAPNAPSELWTTERPENPTAIRVIGGELASGGSFSFQVVITTDGAQPQDVYVNRAQARAEHTALVMRTSASLVVTDYVVEKSSDPESGSTVEPGDTITYTVLVTQQGPVPAGAWFTDDLSAVLDDAVYNDDVAADIGTVSVEDGVLSWEGVVPVGEVATITYSVTVKDVPGLQAEGDTYINNVVESPGCQMAEDCTTEHLVGYFEFSKTSEAAPGSVVQVGEVITYTVLVEQRGGGAVVGASVMDDLTAVLDDATWNGDVVASAGEVSFVEPILSWSGDLAVGEVVELTYSVTVTAAGEGDDQLMNVVSTEDDRGACIPAPDENPDCMTTHQVGDYEVVKTSDPVSGSEVQVGDVIEYTVTVTHVGIAPVAEATLEDDLTGVLDDATWNDDLAASAGEAAYGAPTLSWAGPLGVGEEVTLTYSVTVTAAGDRHLVNVVTTGGQCVPAEGQDVACTTEHFNGAYVFSKTSDPESGSQVGEGEVITYTVVVEHVGSAAVQDAVVVDDLSEVLDVADWNDDATASSGDVTRDGSELTWTGDLEIDQVVTITYSVTVGDEPSATLSNVVSSPDDRALCVPAADGNPDCATEHFTPAAASAALPNTGTDGLITLAAGGGILALLGAALLLGLARRKQQQAALTA